MAKWLIRLILLLAVCVVVTTRLNLITLPESVVYFASLFLLLAIMLILIILPFRYAAAIKKKGLDHTAEEIKQTKLYSDHLKNKKNRWLENNFVWVFVASLIIFGLVANWKPWILLPLPYALLMAWILSEIKLLSERIRRGRILVRLPNVSPHRFTGFFVLVMPGFFLYEGISRGLRNEELIGDILSTNVDVQFFLFMVLWGLQLGWRSCKRPVLTEAGIFPSSLIPWEKIQAYEWDPNDNYLIYRFVAASGRDAVRYLSIPAQEVETVKKLFQDSIDLDQADRPASGLGYFRIACATLILGSLALATWDPLGIEQDLLESRQRHKEQREEKDRTKERKEAAKKKNRKPTLKESIAAFQALGGKIRRNADGKLLFLDLSTIEFTDARLKELKRLTTLTELVLDKTKITDANLVHLKGLTKLEKISLRGTQISDAGLVHLKGWTKLYELSLSDTKITDAGLMHLKTLKNLWHLDLRKTQITDAGVKHLKGLTSLVWLHLSETQITDAGLKYLKGLTQLKKIELSHTKVTDAGVAELKKALPNCEIEH